MTLGRFLLPSHDSLGAVVEGGRVVGRIAGQVPAEILPLDSDQDKIVDGARAHARRIGIHPRTRGGRSLRAP